MSTRSRQKSSVKLSCENTREGGSSRTGTALHLLDVHLGQPRDEKFQLALGKDLQEVLGHDFVQSPQQRLRSKPSTSVSSLEESISRA